MEVMILIQALIFFFLDLFILIKASRNGVKSDTQGIFCVFAFCATFVQFLSVAIEITRTKLVYFNDGIMLGALWLFYILVMMFTLISACCWFEYLLRLLPIGKPHTIPRTLIHVIPVFFYLGFAISAPWNQLVFYLDSDFAYHRGPLFAMQIFVPYFYFVAAIICIVREVRKGNGKGFGHIVRYFIFFFIPPTIGTLIQVVLKFGGYTQIGVSLGMILMYIEMYVKEINESARLKSLEKEISIVDALSRSYVNVFLIYKADKQIEVIKLDSHVEAFIPSELKEEGKRPYENMCRIFAGRKGYIDDAERVIEFLAWENVLAGTRDGRIYETTYQVHDGDIIHHFQIRFLDVEDKNYIVCGFQNIDALVAAEESRTHHLESMNELLNSRMGIIASMSKVYFSSYYIDIEDNSFEELSSWQSIRDTVGTRGNAQESLYLMCNTLIMPQYQEKMRKFVDLSTLDLRLLGKTVESIEYQGISSGWSQMDFIEGDRDEEGRLKHVFVATRIIHEEKVREEENKRNLEEARLKAEAANAAKSAFLARMSHDIRTPLNGIIGLINIDENHADDVELIASNRKKMRVAADHLLSLVSDVLELSKMEDEEIHLAHEPFNILDLATDVLTITALRAAEAGITLEHTDCTHELAYPCVYGSPLHVRQILINIFANATKYNKPHGMISCNARMVEHDEKTVTYCVTISDTGIGMSKEYLKHIFEPFSQERQDARSTFQGTGLGMAIVKRLLDKMNGTIEISSEPGVGSTFAITIPFEIADDSELKEKKDSRIDDISGAKILLVEDNELNKEIAVTILEDAGAVVTTAENGMEALNLYTNHPAGTYDVILMDLMMPIMDGYEATQIIRDSKKEDAKTIPILAMTANAFTEDEEKCLEAGMNGHLAKPIDVKTMMRTLADVIQ